MSKRFQKTVVAHFEAAQVIYCLRVIEQYSVKRPRVLINSSIYPELVYALGGPSCGLKLASRRPFNAGWGL